jgi:hypothetical protein
VILFIVDCDWFVSDCDSDIVECFSSASALAGDGGAGTTDCGL